MNNLSNDDHGGAAVGCLADIEPGQAAANAKPCANCCKPFVPPKYHHRRIFCCAKCKDISDAIRDHERKVQDHIRRFTDNPLECQSCDEPFMPVFGKPRQKFCSAKCQSREKKRRARLRAGITPRRRLGLVTYAGDERPLTDREKKRAQEAGRLARQKEVLARLRIAFMGANP